MNIAFLGCGYVANMYRLTLPLEPSLRLVGVADRDPERARLMAGFTGARAYRSLDEILGDSSVDTVVNLTNPRDHHETTRRCLDAGKHVYTEKPIAMKFEDARALVELAEQQDLVLSSAPCTLLNEAAQTLWRAVRERPIGEVRLVYAEMEDGMVHRMPVRKWINEAGVPWPYKDEFETGCTVEHAGYVLTWLAAIFGPVETVSAFSSCLVPDKTPGESLDAAPDYSVASLRFRSGVVARMTNGIYAPVDHRLRLFGDDGVIMLKDPRDDRSPLVVQRYVTVRRARKLMPFGKRYPTVGGHRKQVKYRGSQRRNFCTGLADMASAIREGRPCRLSAHFSLHVNEVTLAIQRSLLGDGPYRVQTTFDPVEPMPWAK